MYITQLRIASQINNYFVNFGVSQVNGLYALIDLTFAGHSLVTQCER